MPYNFDLSRFLPWWKPATNALARNESMIIFGPRYCGKTALLRALVRHCLTKNDRSLSFIEIPSTPSPNEIDYTSILKGVYRSLSLNKSVNAKSGMDRFKFVDYIRATPDALGGNLTLFIRFTDRGLEDEQNDLLKALHKPLADEFASNNKHLAIIAVDSYSIWHKRSAGPLESELYCFQEKHWRPLREDEVNHCLLKASAEDNIGNNEDFPEFARIVTSLTGGHSGLVKEAVDLLQAKSWQPDPRTWAQQLEETLGNGRVIQRIRHALKEEPKGLAETALEFQTPTYPVELASSRVRLLLQLGILHWKSVTEMQLCSGLIQELINKIGTTSSSKTSRLGTVVSSDYLTSSFEAGDLKPADDDFVVVHISDLHVGDKHAFRFASGKGESLNQDKPSVGELLEKDLSQLNLRGRIDVVVLTGDFVWFGKDAEFRRARQVVNQILDACSVDKGQLVILPGNHDLDWNPTGSTLETESRGDREAFDDFAERYGHDFRLGGAVLRTFTSKSGRRRLHVIAIDSNHVEGRTAAGIGYVSKEALDTAGRLLLTAREHQDSDDPVWISTHHHVFPATSVRLEDAQKARVSVMANAAEILIRAAQWGAEAILHGHEHQPSITVARRWPTRFRERSLFPIASIGAGSFGVEQSRLGPFARHHYYVLYRRTNDLIVRSRSLGEEGVAFIAHSDIVLPLPRKVSSDT